LGQLGHSLYFFNGYFGCHSLLFPIRGPLNGRWRAFAVKSRK
jgi:hypothetical protein